MYRLTNAEELQFKLINTERQVSINTSKTVNVTHTAQIELQFAHYYDHQLGIIIIIIIIA